MDTDEVPVCPFKDCNSPDALHVHPDKDSGVLFAGRLQGGTRPLRPGAASVRGRDVGSGDTYACPDGHTCKDDSCYKCHCDCHEHGCSKPNCNGHADGHTDFEDRKPDADRTNDSRTAKADDRKCIGHALGYLASPFASGHKYATITFEPCGYCGTK